AAALLSLGCLRRRPALAAAVWLAVLCKCATPPLWASPLGVFSWLRAEKSSAPEALPAWVEPRAIDSPSDVRSAVNSPVVPDAVSTHLAWSTAWPWLLVGTWATGFLWTLHRAVVLRRRWLAAVVEDCQPSESLIQAVSERSQRLNMAPPRLVMVAADA